MGARRSPYTYYSRAAQTFSYQQPQNGATLDQGDYLRTFCSAEFDHLLETWSLLQPQVQRQNWRDLIITKQD